jgi:hypothetical protein
MFFGFQVVSTSKDKPLSARLGQSARELTFDKHEWVNIASDLNKIFQNLGPIGSFCERCDYKLSNSLFTNR